LQIILFGLNNLNSVNIRRKLWFSGCSEGSGAGDRHQQQAWRSTATQHITVLSLLLQWRASWGCIRAAPTTWSYR